MFHPKFHVYVEGRKCFQFIKDAEEEYVPIRYKDIRNPTHLTIDGYIDTRFDFSKFDSIEALTLFYGTFDLDCELLPRQHAFFLTVTNGKIYASFERPWPRISVIEWDTEHKPYFEMEKLFPGVHNITCRRSFLPFVAPHARRIECQPKIYPNEAYQFLKTHPGCEELTLRFHKEGIDRNEDIRVLQKIWVDFPDFSKVQDYPVDIDQRLENSLPDFGMDVSDEEEDV